MQLVAEGGTTLAIHNERSEGPRMKTAVQVASVQHIGDVALERDLCNLRIVLPLDIHDSLMVQNERSRRIVQCLRQIASFWRVFVAITRIANGIALSIDTRRFYHGKRPRTAFGIEVLVCEGRDSVLAPLLRSLVVSADNPHTNESYFRIRLGRNSPTYSARRKAIRKRKGIPNSRREYFRMSCCFRIRSCFDSRTIGKHDSHEPRVCRKHKRVDIQQTSQRPYCGASVPAPHSVRLSLSNCMISVVSL